MYDMYPWADPADSAAAETRQAPVPEPRQAPVPEPRQAPVPEPRQAPVPEARHVSEGRHVPAAAIRAVQVALDRRDNGGDAIAPADQPGPSQPGASQPPASRTRQ